MGWVLAAAQRVQGHVVWPPIAFALQIAALMNRDTALPAMAQALILKAIVMCTLQITALMKQNAALEAKVSNLSTAEGPSFGLQALGAVPKFTCKACK